MKTIPEGLIDRIIQRLVDTVHPREIYLYGSHASGTAHPHSDLDLLVIAGDEDGDLSDLDLRARLALWGIGVPVDLVVLHQSQKRAWESVKFSLAYEATHKGKLLYAA